VKAHNAENPELYAVYPFRLYGQAELGKNDLQAARDTYDIRRIKSLHCWGQDPIDAAYLGLTDEAKKLVVHDLTNQDKRQKFPAFWDKGHDYAPDEDIGGNGEQALQLMLMQTEGKRSCYSRPGRRSGTAPSSSMHHSRPQSAGQSPTGKSPRSPSIPRIAART